MDKHQYQCVKTFHGEIDSLIADGYRKIRKTNCGCVGLFAWLEHPNGTHITIEANCNLDKMVIYRNGKIVKCQKFNSKNGKKD